MPRQLTGHPPNALSRRQALAVATAAHARSASLSAWGTALSGRVVKLPTIAGRVQALPLRWERSMNTRTIAVIALVIAVIVLILLLM